MKSNFFRAMAQMRPPSVLIPSNWVRINLKKLLSGFYVYLLFRAVSRRTVHVLKMSFDWQNPILSQKQIIFAFLFPKCPVLDFIIVFFLRAKDYIIHTSHDKNKD